MPHVNTPEMATPESDSAQMDEKAGARPISPSMPPLEEAISDDEHDKPDVSESPPPTPTDNFAQRRRPTIIIADDDDDDESSDLPLLVVKTPTGGIAAAPPVLRKRHVSAAEHDTPLIQANVDEEKETKLTFIHVAWITTKVLLNHTLHSIRQRAWLEWILMIFGALAVVYGLLHIFGPTWTDQWSNPTTLMGLSAQPMMYSDNAQHQHANATEQVSVEECQRGYLLNNDNEPQTGEQRNRIRMNDLFSALEHRMLQHGDSFMCMHHVQLASRSSPVVKSVYTKIPKQICVLRSTIDTGAVTRMFNPTIIGYSDTQTVYYEETSIQCPAKTRVTRRAKYATVRYTAASDCQSRIAYLEDIEAAFIQSALEEFQGQSLCSGK
jgi:hypothetical protein